MRPGREGTTGVTAVHSGDPGAGQGLAPVGAWQISVPFGNGLEDIALSETSPELHAITNAWNLEAKLIKTVKKWWPGAEGNREKSVQT